VTGPAPAFHTITENNVADIAGRYALGELRAAWRPVQGFVNDNWVLETERGRFFLKHRHPSVSRPDRIRCEHALMDWLVQHDFPAPALVRTPADETLLVMDNGCFEVQRYIEGRSFQHDRTEHLLAAARTLGLYHARVEDFGPDAFCRIGALYHPDHIQRKLDGLHEAWQLEHVGEQTAAITELETLTDVLATRFAKHTALPSLVIHGDYYAGNLLFDGDLVVGVVDYDKASWQPRIAEVAEALIYFSSPRPGHLKHLVYPGILQWPRLTRFLEAYCGPAPLWAAEADTLADYVECIWLQVSLDRLLERGGVAAEACEAIGEVLTLAEWACDRAARISKVAQQASKERS